MSSFQVRRLVCAVGAVAVAAGCRTIPVQITRVAQIETYTQTYEIEPGNARRVFEKLLGRDNWGVLDRRWSTLQAELSISRLISTLEVKGTLNMTFSILPSNAGAFTAEGTGRYYVVQKEAANDLILFTGDFFVVDDLHSLGELDDGEIVVGIRQQQVRHFAEGLNYYNDVRVDLRIAVDTSLAKHGIYSLDYASDQHRVELDGQVIGRLRFDRPRPGFRKLIDLRGLQFLRRDYRQKYQEASRASAGSGGGP